MACPVLVAIEAYVDISNSDGSPPSKIARNEMYDIKPDIRNSAHQQPTMGETQALLQPLRFKVFISIPRSLLFCFPILRPNIFDELVYSASEYTDHHSEAVVKGEKEKGNHKSH